MSTRPGSVRAGIGMTVLTAVGAAAWFGVDVAGAAAGWWGDDIALVIALVGILLLVLAHERQAGDRWLAGMALTVVPALVLLVAPMSTAEDGAASAAVWVGVGAVLLLASMSAAALVRGRWGEAADTGGAGFYG